MRDAILRSLCEASNRLKVRFGIRVNFDGRPFLSSNSIPPSIKTWRLVESLSLLCLLLKAEGVDDTTSVHLLRSQGPIQIRDGGLDRFIWTQKPMKAEISRLGGVPDIIVTNNSKPPSPESQNLGAQQIRGEFGKAYDLRVASYLIWALHSPSSTSVTGARELGLDIEAVGFDGPYSGVLMSNPDALIAHIANTQEAAKVTKRFALAARNAAREIGEKLLELPDASSS